MAVLVGKEGKVQISDSSNRGNLTGSSGGSSARGFMHTLLNLTNWSLSQPGPELIDATVFGDDWKKSKIGVNDGGTLTIGGYYDWADSTGQRWLSSKWNQGTVMPYPTANSSAAGTSNGWRFELWPSDDTSVAGAKPGCFKFSTAAGTTLFTKELIIQSFNAAQDKSGLGTIDMTFKISGGYFAFSTKMKTTP